MNTATVMTVDDLLDFFLKTQQDNPTAEFVVSNVTGGIVIVDCPPQPTIH